MIEENGRSVQYSVLRSLLSLPLKQRRRQIEGSIPH